jgi:hypothetical protein
MLKVLENRLLRRVFGHIIWGLYNRPEVAAVPRESRT